MYYWPSPVYEAHLQKDCGDLSRHLKSVHARVYAFAHTYIYLHGYMSVLLNTWFGCVGAVRSELSRGPHGGTTKLHKSHEAVLLKHGLGGGGERRVPGYLIEKGLTKPQLSYGQYFW